MSRQVQLRRGTTAQNNNFTGAVGEVTVDTTAKTLRVHDGTTPGGTVLAKKADVLQTDLANIGAAGKKAVSHHAALSDNVSTITLAPDTRWTAPSDGFIFIYGTASSANQGIWLALRTSNDSTAIGYDDAFSSAANQKLTVSIPMAAGQKIFYSISTGISNVVITFVKSKGDS